MLDVKTRKDHNICPPIIIAVYDSLDSVHRSIRSIFTIQGMIALMVLEGKWSPLCDGREFHEIGSVQHVSCLAITAAERRVGQAIGQDGSARLSHVGCRATEKARMLLWDWV